MKMSIRCLIFIVFSSNFTPKIAVAAVVKYKDFREALRAGDNAKNKNVEVEALDDLANHAMNTREDVLALEESLRGVENKVSKGMSIDEATWRLKKLNVPLKQLLESHHHAVTSELIEREADRLPNISFRTVQTDKALNLRSSRLALLIQIAGAGKNRDALGVLRKISKRNDLIGAMAITAIAKIGAPEDLETFITEIKKNPQFQANLAGFGPTLIDRIISDVDRPETNETIRQALIARLRQASGPASVTRFRALLGHRDPRVVQEAASALKDSLGPHDKPLVVEMLQSTILST